MDDLASKEVVRKRQGGGVRRVDLPIDPLPIVYTSSAWSSSAGATTIPHQIVLGRSKTEWSRRQVCIQRTRNGGLGMPDPESDWLTEMLSYLCRSLSGDEVWRRKVSDSFPRLESDPKAVGRRRLVGEAPFVRKCRTALCKLSASSDLSRPRKELYRELVIGSASDPLREWHCWKAEETTPIGIRRQVRASWTILSSRLPGGLQGTRYSFSAWISKRAWQTCPIVLAAAVA